MSVRMVSGVLDPALQDLNRQSINETQEVLNILNSPPLLIEAVQQNFEPTPYEKNMRILYQEWYKMWHRQYFETGSWKRGNEGSGFDIIVASGRVRRLVKDMAREQYHENYLIDIENYWRAHSQEDAELYGALWEWVAQRPFVLGLE